MKIFAESDSNGKDNYEGLDLKDLNTTEYDDESIHANYNVLNNELRNEGDITLLPLTRNKPEIGFTERNCRF